MPTTLIVGASRGIGLELVGQALATARSDEGLATLQALRLDVAEPASVSGLAWQRDGEKIDTAWHVAGVMCSRADASQPPTQPEFDRVMHANVLGAMQLIPLVAAAGERMAFLSSVMGQIGGASAPVTVQHSAAGLRRVVANLASADSGAFIQYDGQRFSSW